MELTTNRFAGLFEKLSYGLLLILGVGLFVFFLPIQGSSIDVVRAYFVAGATLLSAAFLIIAFGFDRTIQLFPFSKRFFVLLLLPLVFLVASFFSSSMVMSLIGVGFEPFSAFMVTIYACIAYLAAFHARNAHRRKMLYGSVIVSALAALLFQFVRIVSGGTLFSFGLFTEVITNLTGRWQDLAVLGALFASAALLYMLKRPTGLKALLAVLLLLLGLFFTFLISVPIIWLSLLLVAGYAAYVTRGLYASSSETLPKEGIMVKIQKAAPFAVSGIAVVFILFQFFTAQNPLFYQNDSSVNPLRSTRFFIPFVDTPPTFLTDSYFVVKQTLTEKPVFGVGPSMFSKEWAKYKPQAVNETPWWAIEYAVAAGLPLTVAAMTGLVGLFIVFLFFFVVARTALRAITGAYVEQAPQIFVPAVLTLALLVVLLAHTPGLALSVLAFGLIGILLGDAYGSRDVPVDGVDLVSKKNLLYGGVFAALIIVLFYAYGIRAVTYASLIENRGSSESIIAALEGATRLVPIDSYHRSLAEAYVGTAASLSDTAEQTRLVTLAEASIAEAIEFDTTNYLNHIARGNFYSEFAANNDQAYQLASQAYADAVVLNPTNPTIELLIARLEITKGDLVKAQAAVEKALTMKTNYADAAVLLSQLSVEQRNADLAIRAAEYAVRSDVNSTSALYQYGMLLYQTGNYEQAIPPLERLIALSGNRPDAGAVYALGDSYKRVGRTSQAIQVFEILNQALPGNADIESQLRSLQDTLEEESTTTDSE